MSERLLHLQRIRKESNLSMRQLAEFSGVSLLTIQKLESGSTEITQAKLETLIKIANALEVKVIDLLPNDLRNTIA